MMWKDNWRHDFKLWVSFFKFQICNVRERSRTLERVAFSHPPSKLREKDFPPTHLLLPKFHRLRLPTHPCNLSQSGRENPNPREKDFPPTCDYIGHRKKERFRHSAVVSPFVWELFRVMEELHEPSKACHTRKKVEVVVDVGVSKEELCYGMVKEAINEDKGEDYVEEPFWGSEDPCQSTLVQHQHQTPVFEGGDEIKQSTMYDRMKAEPQRQIKSRAKRTPFTADARRKK
ncbi:uncharacterized protein HKW66_Vig0007770 [Vigna angularis]|uniref:Uncharacterized protein n=1 Tax=Phaseolus angularis TaxID=3914 RepID=A0A8T0LER9_PHAAN|nr:uncharacterized protein HKW66_Vig0007770 [Vigna angularis]